MNHNKNLRVIAYVLLVCMLFTIFPGGAIAAITNSVDEVTWEVKRVFANAADSTTPGGMQLDNNESGDSEGNADEEKGIMLLAEDDVTAVDSIIYDGENHTITFVDANAPANTRRYDLHLYAFSNNADNDWKPEIVETKELDNPNLVAFIKAEWKAMDNNEANNNTSGGVNLTTPSVYGVDFTVPTEDGSTFSAVINLTQLKPWAEHYERIGGSNTHVWAELWACDQGRHIGQKQLVYLGPANSWAEFAGVDSGKYSVVVGENATTYYSFNSAVKAANGVKNAVIQLLSNVNETLVVPADADVTLDLNGYTIDGSVNNTTTDIPYGHYNDGIFSKGILTIKDTSEAKTGKVTGLRGITNLGSLTVESGTVETKTVNGYEYVGIYNMSGAKSLTITGGTIKGFTMALCDESTNSINSVDNCTLVCKETYKEVGGYGWVIGGFSNIGGTWTIGKDVTMKNAFSASQWVNTTNKEQYTDYNRPVTVLTGSEGAAAIFGTTVQSDGFYSAEVVTEDELTSGLNNMSETVNTAHITLLNNLAGGLTVKTGTTVTLDLNGYTMGQITNKGTLTINDSSEGKTGLVQGSYGVYNEGTLTVNGGTLYGTGHEGIQNATSGTKLTINDGIIKGINYAICDYDSSSVNEVNGGTLICKRNSFDGNCGYVIGGYGKAGGTWTFNKSVTMENAAGPYWINTNTSNGVTIANNNKAVILSTEDEPKKAKVVAISDLSGELTALVGEPTTITLFANVTSANDSTITIPTGTTVTLDLNGYSVGNTISNGSAIINDGNLTVKDSRASENNGISSNHHGITNKHVLTVNSGSIQGEYNGIYNIPNVKSITINGGKITGGNLAVCDQAPNSVNVVNDGTLECSGSSTDAGCGYVVGSYGENKGGLWAIADNVILKNTENKKEQLVNTDKDTGLAKYAQQVSITNKTGLNNLQAGDRAYIKLDNNVTGPITIPADTTVILDLNGRTIDGGVINYGKLIIMDSDAEAEGTISGAIGVTNYNELTVNGGNILGNGYEGISNMTSAVSLDINGGTVAGNGYAVCDYGVNSTNTVTGGTLTCNDRPVGGGIGYVIGSFGGSKGGTWALGVGAKFVNNINAAQFINTDEKGQATSNQQVAVANWNAVTIKDGVVVAASSDDAAAQALNASKTTAKATVEAKATATEDAGANKADVTDIFEKAKADIGKATTAAEVAAAVDKAITDLEALAVAAETAKSETLTKDDKAEIDAIKNTAGLSDEVRNAKVRNILDKADLIAEINSNNGLSGKEKTDFVKKVEAVKAEAQAALNENTDEYELDLIVAKANAKYEAIRMVADAYPQVTSAGEKALDRALDDALKAIDDAADTGAVERALQALRDEVESIKAKYKPSSGGFSGTYNYPVGTSSASNGKVSLSDSYANAGETVVITVTPNNGYGVADVIVTDADGNVIPVKALGGGEYSFVMPEGKVKVDAVCKPAITLTIDKYEANVFGKIVKNDVVPMLTDNRTMLPIRFVAEALGADVAWDAAKQLVTITKDDTVIKIYIGQKQAYVNGEAVELDAAAFIKNGRTYLPLRFVAEHLDADVHWDAVTKMVTVIPE